MAPELLDLKTACFTPGAMEFWVGPHLNERFPIRREVIYLNHAAISPLPEATRIAIAEHLDIASHRMHLGLEQWMADIERTRAIAAEILRADPEEVAFCKGTTHGLMLVGLGVDWQPGDVVVVEEHAFPANRYPWLSMRHRGVRLWQWQERDGRHDLDELAEFLRRARVRMVALTSVSFSTGFRHDLDAIGKLCREHGALFCVDAIQSLGAAPLDAHACGADFIIAGGQKWLLGPEGSGIFYCRRESLSQLGEQVIGWRGREDSFNYGKFESPPKPDASRFEEGAVSMAAMIGLGASLALVRAIGVEDIAARIRGNIRLLRAALEPRGWNVITPREEVHCAGILSASHPAIASQRACDHLRAHGVICSARRGYLRISPHFYNTPDEMVRTAALLAELKPEETART